MSPEEQKLVEEIARDARAIGNALREETAALHVAFANLQHILWKRYGRREVIVTMETRGYLGWLRTEAHGWRLYIVHDGMIVPLDMDRASRAMRCEAAACLEALDEEFRSKYDEGAL